MSTPPPPHQLGACSYTAGPELSAVVGEGSAAPLLPQVRPLSGLEAGVWKGGAGRGVPSRLSPSVCKGRAGDMERAMRVLQDQI